MIKAILFDFDGTLIDSNQNTINYYKETMKHFNLKAPSADAFQTIFGFNTRDMWEKLYPDLKRDKIQEILDYSAQVSMKTLTTITFFPHALSTLKSLKKQYLLGLVTSRGKKSLEILFNHHELSEYFTCVVDREDVNIHKPNPEGILIALKRLKIKNSEVIYVGDTEVDVLTAHNAHIKCILISPFNKSYNADYHVKEISEILAIIKTL